MLALSLQLERNGSTGDDHPITVPKLNAPIVARMKKKYDKMLIFLCKIVQHSVGLCKIL